MLLGESFLASLTSFDKTMETTLWNKLPLDVQIEALLWFPPLELRRLSFTCKYFQLLLSHPPFAIHYDGHRLTTPTFVIASIRLDREMHNTFLKSVIWQQRTDVYFQMETSLFDRLPAVQLNSWTLCSYGDGFVCLRGLLTTSRRDKYKFLVFNPLFPHEYKILTFPAQCDGRRFYTAVAFDRKNDVCKLIIWCFKEGDRVMTFLYNFKEGTWKTIAECSNGSREHSLIDQSGLVKERFLCWLCTDLISSVNTVLVFDVDEETWKEPIPALGTGFFMCMGTPEKELYGLSETFEEQKMKFGLWKFDMDERVWGLVEFIPPPPKMTIYRARGGPGVLWLEDPWTSRGQIKRWVCDISRHCWQQLGDFGLLERAACFESSLFRLGILESHKHDVNQVGGNEGGEKSTKWGATKKVKKQGKNKEFRNLTKKIENVIQ